MKRPSEQQNLFCAVIPRKIPDVVYKQLVALISSGRLKPGERLPSEREMATDMGISRQSIREAINKAKTVGLIEVRQGGGTVVFHRGRTPEDAAGHHSRGAGRKNL